MFKFVIFSLFFYSISECNRCGDRFRCSDADGCIPQSWVCDGQPDCPDDSDEKNCTKVDKFRTVDDVHLCTVEEHECGGGRCINLIFVCDGINDCEDNSDENTTLCTDVLVVPRNLRQNNNVHELIAQAGLKSSNSSIIFRFYSRRLPWGVEINLNRELLKPSSYENDSETKILIHDYHNGEVNLHELKHAYLWQTNEKPNVITVDYTRFRRKGSLFFHLFVKKLTQAVHRLLKEMQAKGFRKVHLIGLGLGAHIAGAATNNLAPSIVTRVTGLDPIGLEFDKDDSLPQISIESADFVDVIMTNMDRFGSKKNRGDIMFYPNGGGSQPKCDNLTSHMRSYYYFLESITSPRRFLSYQISSWKKFLTKKTSNVEYMGEYVSMNKYGPFYLFVDADDNSNETIHKLPFGAESCSSLEPYQSSGPCAENNGGCDQICENVNNAAVCSCYEGFDLQENSRDCKQGDCTYRIRKHHGTILGPNFEGRYGGNIHCNYHFITNPGCHIELTFMRSGQSYCNVNDLKIYDGNSSHSALLGSFCGSGTDGSTIVSNSNHLFVTLQPDGGRDYRRILTFSFSSKFYH